MIGAKESSRLLILAGDGIGPEICKELVRVIDWFRRAVELTLEVIERPFGGAGCDADGTPLSDETLVLARTSGAVVLGAVGGPKWAGLPREIRPEAGLLRLRKELDVFANVRPAFCFKPLVDASSLKRDLVAGLDIVIVRELLGGVYFGQPRGIERIDDHNFRAVDTQVYETAEIERVARVAFELAREQRHKLTSVDKSNVMETGLLWRRVVTELHRRDYPDVALDHLYADNALMQLVRKPKQFDVMLMDNLFGDLLSDAAAMLTGSLGMLPSAAFGAPSSTAIYEPIHGSDPDIAGQGIANPLAAILSFEMALRRSFGRPDLADRLRRAVEEALWRGARSRDLGGAYSTVEMGDAVLAALDCSNAQAPLNVGHEPLVNSI